MKAKVLVRKCSICGHDMNIFLSKTNRLPKAVGYFSGCEERGESINDEYWECAFCLDGYCPYPYETMIDIYDKEKNSYSMKKIMMNVDITPEEVYNYGKKNDGNL